MERQVRIRAFTAADYDQVVELWRESGLTIKHSDTLPEIEKLLTLPANTFFVAENDIDTSSSLAIVGAVIGAWDGRRGWIYHLAVKQIAQRGGIGRQLMHAVEQALRAHGATKINLLVEPGNQQATQFYRALGYSAQPLQFFSKMFES